MASKKLVERYLDLLAVNRDPLANKDLLRHSPDKVIKTICEIALNVAKGPVKISRNHAKKLKRYKSQILNLVNKRPIKKTKRFLVQKGGAFFVPLLLSAAISAIPSIVSALTNDRSNK